MTIPPMDNRAHVGAENKGRTKLDKEMAVAGS